MKYHAMSSGFKYEARGNWQQTPLLMRLMGKPPERRRKYSYDRLNGQATSEEWEYRSTSGAKEYR